MDKTTIITIIQDEFENINTACCYIEKKNIVEELFAKLDNLLDDNYLYDKKLLEDIKERVNYTNTKKTLFNKDTEKIINLFGFDIVSSYILYGFKEQLHLNFIEEQEKDISKLELMKQINSVSNIEIQIIEEYFNIENECDKIDDSTDILDALICTMEKLDNKVNGTTFNKNIEEIILKSTIFLLIKDKNKISLDIETIIDDTKDIVINNFNIFRTSDNKLFNAKTSNTFLGRTNKELCLLFFITAYQTIIYYSLMKVLSLDNNIKRDIKNKLTIIKNNIDLSVEYSLISKECVDNEKFINIFNFISVKNKMALNFLVLLFEKNFNIDINEKKYSYLKSQFGLDLKSFKKFKSDVKAIYN
ncbi:MAG: hypothetical protein DRG78_19285 [Epsilonproteobacteria bacterium]|nr:MAG: hypothetical protein DRG78_19285 [Campylobacterota bacterium]